MYQIDTQDKESLREAIILGLKRELATATMAADLAKETATNKETAAENKYDTFGLEASYLAHGQSKRAAEILQSVEHYKSVAMQTFTQDTEIALTAVVSLENSEGELKHFFLGVDAGGLNIHWREMDLMIITPQTPLGRQLMGKQLSDSVELVMGNSKITYHIVAIC